MEESVEDFYATVFKGTYQHRIDRKGRLPVPAPFRRWLAGQQTEALVLTILDQCVAAYPPSEWRKLEVQLASLPSFSRPVKALTRLLSSRAADCRLDGQGRILLPPALRAAADLDREAVVVGVLNRFEVWRPEAWERFLEDSERLLEDATLDIHWPPPPADATPIPARLPQAKPKP